MAHMIDGFRPMPRRDLPPRPMPRLVLKPRPVASRPLTTVQPKPQVKQNWREKLKWGGIVIVGIFAGLLLQVFPLGYLAVFIYGIIAIFKRLPSRLTFSLAVVTLVLAPLGIIVGHAGLANGFSLISFLLLTVGVVTLGIELLRKGGRAIS